MYPVLMFANKFFDKEMRKDGNIHYAVYLTDFFAINTRSIMMIAYNKALEEKLAMKQ